jgi:hypothetical protein
VVSPDDVNFSEVPGSIIHNLNRQAEIVDAIINEDEGFNTNANNQASSPALVPVAST